MPSEKKSSSDRELLAEISRSCPSIALTNAARAVERVFADEFSGLEIGTRQFSLLVALSLIGPCSISKLANAAGLSATTLSRNLTRLGGLVEVRGSDDRRERVIALSSAGRRELKRAVEAWGRAMETLRGRIGAQALADLNISLAKVRVAIEPAGPGNAT